MRRVVITGIGAVTPLANSFEDSWKAIISGQSGIDLISRFDTAGLPWKVAGEVKGFDAACYISLKEQRRLDPFVQYAVAAALMAAEDSGLLAADNAGYAASGGVIVGSSRGGISTIEQACGRPSQLQGATETRRRRVSSYLMPASTTGMASSFISQKLGIRGHCLGISNACASGANAVGEAFRLIRGGYPGPVVAGGSEAVVCRFCLEGYGATGALSKGTDASASRPFDRNRDGFVLAEGACILILEELGAAMRRRAAVFGEISGYGTSADAFHQTRPHSEGEARALAAALADAVVPPGDIDCVNAHATGTVMGDAAECRAMERVFGKRAAEIPVSALKSMTGHMLGASGALEIASMAMSLREGILLPTINLTGQDPRCSVHTTPVAERADLRIGLSSSFGFGGVNAAVVLKRFEEGQTGFS